jgi:hypothetical protein
MSIRIPARTVNVVPGNTNDFGYNFDAAKARGLSATPVLRQVRPTISSTPVRDAKPVGGAADGGNVVGGAKSSEPWLEDD